MMTLNSNMYCNAPAEQPDHTLTTVSVAVDEPIQGSPALVKLRTL